MGRTLTELGGKSGGQVTLSYLVAAMASFIALRLAPVPVVAHGSGHHSHAPRVLSAGCALGAGIWAMHFTGMAAFHLAGMKLGYRWDVTALSLLVGMAFTAMGFATLTLLEDAREALLVAGIPMSAGILAMHFLGMLAMTGDMEVRYDPMLVLASGIIAVVASIGSLWLSTMPHRALRGVLAAMVMASAICGMHYTAMAAAQFTHERPELAGFITE